MKPLAEILEITRSVGWGASDLLRSYYQGKQNDGDLEIEDKKDGPVTAADIAVNHYILDHLKSKLSDQDFAYMSEETYKSQNPEQLKNSWVWVIDPLDGTRDFIEKTGEYAIHIALVKDGRPVLSVVAQPEAQKLYYATQGGGAFVETRDAEGGMLYALRPCSANDHAPQTLRDHRTVQPIKVSERNKIEDLTIVVSRTHRDQRFNQLLEQLPTKNLKYVGSVGCKVITIVEQQADIYISLSGKSAPKDWDMAAPELILTEAGGQFTRVDGTPLKYNTGDVNQWGALIASNGHCHTDLCTQVAEILAQVDGSKS